MKLTNVACNNCGAPLEVPEDAKYVTCRHCQSNLQIRHTDTALYTEKLDEIDARTERIEDKLESLTLETELARLEQSWARERETYMVQTENGGQQLPTQAGSLIGGIMVVGFGIFWTIMAAQMSTSFAFFGVIFILFGIGVSAYGYSKAKDYQAALRRYRRQRANLIRRKNGE